ncbi:hypothetical protein AX774_g6549 [Zancudomyces culisetae]|uniref:Uncharacterized protein n=1 Tax=Zancudomyces culisetae TaxID=1213189 RepID=A0A1R1PGP1_ZANCU|nr:hypothetical protein AX774_g6549 [Zancudomyces culisetae]|eukprot:OMH80022.1 hypothetical protein AX774_g6549 [Zancudomyces culisetae]
MVVRLTAFTSHNNLAYTESTESVSSYKLTDTDNEFNKVTRKDSLDRRLVIIFNNIASYMKSLVSEACGGKICQKMKYSDEPLGSRKDIVDDFSSSIEKYSHPYPGSVEYYSNGEVIVKQLRLKPLESKNSYLNGSPIHATLRNKYKKRIGIVSSERIDINNILERGRLGSEKDKNSDKINVSRKQDEPSTQKSASDIEFELIVNISDQTNVNNSIENEEPADRFTKVKAEEQSSGGKVFDKKEEYGNECDSDLVSTAIKSSLGSQVSCMSSASLSSAFFKKRMFNKLVYTQDAEKPKTVNPFVQFLTFRRLKKSKELYRYLEIVDFIDS